MPLPITTLTYQEQRTIDYYDVQGQQWSEQHVSNSFWSLEIDTFAKHLKTGSLLELGVGAGQEVRHLIQRGYDYTGIDLSEKFLSLARQLNPGAKFVTASLYDLPFSAHAFDGFWAANVYLHVPKNRIDEAFESLKKVLKPGAVGFISLKAGQGEETDQETGRFFAYYKSDEFKQILNRHNFVVLEETERTEAKRIKTYSWLCFWVAYKPAGV